MTRDEIIAEMAKLIAELQVPVSLGVPLGVAREAWSKLHQELVGFGWSGAESIEATLRERLVNADG